ncbi:MAG: hydroxymethylbilane synthase [Dehalococcoidia bacterium]|nr:hydroxymethylbilane synthase [Dehalococcoidia bacterium]MSQ17119.1 hydroxymethylbilane synthase [Dehalococcoidia bacterium]
MAPATNSRTLRVGTRGSALALRQTEETISRLRDCHPGIQVEVVTVRTQGDADQSSPLATLGRGIFVKEIERELLAGRLDLAVHSLKDVPTALPPGLVIGAVLPRQDPRDVLVNRWGCRLDQLPAGARIGTSSPRREAQLRDACPQVSVLPIRGNVETRLNKATGDAPGNSGDSYDGAVLAAAGLIRLGLAEHIAEYLSPQEFVPPPGQGVLAVEARAEDGNLLELLRPVDDATTRYAATAERAFLEKLGGGCQVPVGAFARSEGELLMLTVYLGAPGGGKSFRAKVRGLTHDPLRLASDAYLALVERGGGELLKQAASEG